MMERGAENVCIFDFHVDVKFDALRKKARQMRTQKISKKKIKLKNKQRNNDARTDDKAGRQSIV